MPQINDILSETGDEALDLIKTTFKDLLFKSKNDTEQIIKETGDKLEEWLVDRANNEIDDYELKSLLETRRRVVEEFILTKEIEARATLEKISIGLIDIITNKFIGAIF